MPKGGTSVLQPRTARSLTAIHLRSLCLDPSQTSVPKFEHEVEQPSPERSRRFSQDSFVSASSDNTPAASLRRSQSRNSTHSNTSKHLHEPPASFSLSTSSTASVSPIEAHALNSRARARTTSSASAARIRPTDVTPKQHCRMYGSADEAAQSAERQKAKIRVLKDQRPCIAVLVVQDKQKNDHVIWASDTQHQRPSADWDWTVQMDQSDLNPMLAGQGLVRIDIWAYEEDGLDASRGKGKQKAADQPAAELNATNQGSWQLVLQHNIDLESLINLGTDPRTFGSFDSNSLLLQFNTSDFYLVPTQLLENTSSKHVSFDSVMQQSRREIKMAHAATPDDLFALLSSEKHLQRNQATKSQTHAMDERMWSVWQHLREASEQREHTRYLRDASDDLGRQCEKTRADLAQRRQVLDARRRRLATASRTLAQERKRLQSDQVSIEEKQSKLHITRVDAACARSEKLGTLDFIFKIEPTKTPLVFSLLGLVLPNSEGLTEEHSAVLGIAALLVNILGAYLGVGLHYPLLFAGSRSLAVDEISLIKGPRTFPLYAQGVEDYRFHYAVFLLNKDIEQLCMSQRVLCTDLRQTLPNLANLLLTVTARSRPLPTSSSSTFSERHAERTKSVTFQEPLQESINSPSSPQSMDLADSSSPAATVKPRKRAKSPTPSEKIKLVTTPSANQLDEQVASDKPPTGNKSKSSLAHGSIPEQTAI